MIIQIRHGTNLDGLYNKNDIECIDFVEKMWQCFTKKPASEVIKSFELFFIQ